MRFGVLSRRSSFWSSSRPAMRVPGRPAYRCWIMTVRSMPSCWQHVASEGPRPSADSRALQHGRSTGLGKEFGQALGRGVPAERLRGRSFGSAATNARCPRLWAERACGFGKVRRSRGRWCSRWSRVTKADWVSEVDGDAVARPNAAWPANLVLWSHVMDCARSAGNAWMVSIRATRPGSVVRPSGRCTSIT